MDATYFHERRIKEARLRDHFARHISEVLTDRQATAVPCNTIRACANYLIVCVSPADHVVWCVGVDHGEDGRRAAADGEGGGVG